VTDTTDKLDVMLAEQLRLQIESYGQDPGELSDARAIEFVHWNVTALVDELHEALAETHWKPWATGTGFKDKDAFKSELVDAWHFLMNLCLVVGMDATELFDKYRVKHEINARRQLDGYDGVSTKCPGCGRALDDVAVRCRLVTPLVDDVAGREPWSHVWCERLDMAVPR
jgi:hypothetical protein